jgi:hypothetical protein
VLGVEGVEVSEETKSSATHGRRVARSPPPSASASPARTTLMPCRDHDP